MTPRLLLEPDAELDLEGARIWFEERSKGLGAEFLRNVRATLAVAEETVTAVIGCLHTRRDPTIWQSRREQPGT